MQLMNTSRMVQTLLKLRPAFSSAKSSFHTPSAEPDTQFHEVSILTLGNWCTDFVSEIMKLIVVFLTNTLNGFIRLQYIPIYYHMFFLIFQLLFPNSYPLYTIPLLNSITLVAQSKAHYLGTVQVKIKYLKLANISAPSKAPSLFTWNYRE